MSAQPTVFIVDGDAAVRHSLAELAGTLQISVKCYETGESFLASIDPSLPGCLVLDMVLPDMDGTELQEKLGVRGIRLPVLFVSSCADVYRAVRAMKQGAIDVWEKPFDPKLLSAAIRTAIELDATRRQKQMRWEEIEGRFARLTSDERLVLQCIIAGKTNKEIAVDLDVSLRTMYYRRAGLMRKLKVRSRAALIELLISTNKSLVESSH